MAKLTGQKFTVESFKEQQDWIAKLFQPLNSFFSEIISAFSNDISVEDNLAAEIKEINFVNTATNYPLSFKTKLVSNPKGLFVLYCYDKTNAEMNFSQAVWCNWVYVNGTIQIKSVQGLTAGHSYTMRVYVVYK